MRRFVACSTASLCPAAARKRLAKPAQGRHCAIVNAGSNVTCSQTVPFVLAGVHMVTSTSKLGKLVPPRHQLVRFGELWYTSPGMAAGARHSFTTRPSRR